jgi:DNA-binding MarR family transcriptional regulator
MTATTRPFEQLLGQTEKTMNAILDRLLAGSVSEPQWVTLVLIAGGAGSDGHDQLTARVAEALKVDHGTAANRVGQLAAKGLVQKAPQPGSAVTLSAAGEQFAGRIRGQTSQITQRLWGDLPATDMQVASQVLSTVLERAQAELGSR